MTTPTREVFINLPVRDLKASMAFFSGLGFTFNKQFTDDNAACMILSDKGFVMLLQETYFRTFTSRSICDTSRSSEALVAFSCVDRAEVDALTDKAIAAGGSVAAPSQDHGFMYARSFYDLDGHHWEPVWMDPAAVEQS